MSTSTGSSRKLILDIEANGLTPTQIWCVVTKDVESASVATYRDADEFRRITEGDVTFIGHNLIGYDIPVLHRLWNIDIPKANVIDTLVLSRLWHAGLDDGHSLESWGVRLHHPKVHLDISFDDYSPAILERCINDVDLNLKVYNSLMKQLGGKNSNAFSAAIAVEHELAYICRDMQLNGFAFDYTGANTIRNEVQADVERFDTELRAAFPPRSRLIREVTPRTTKVGTISKVGISNWYEGTDYTRFTPDSSFSLVEWEPFNPGSTRQIVERLNEAGWEPTDRTSGHLDAKKAKEDLAHYEEYGWKVNEVNLATLPDTAPAAARLLVKRILLASRVRTLDQWMEFYNSDTGRIHGKFTHIGARTQRMSHKEPNMGNVATKKSIKYNSKELKELATELGGRMRSLWCAAPGSLLVGTDMESAHLRIFAHLIDDKEFTQSLLTGKKEDGTDPHSVNKRILGDLCVDRDRAKTFIFSFLNGAGGNKVSEIFGCKKSAAQEALDRFVRSYPGLDVLKREVIPRDAKRGWFKGLDGRLVLCDSEHHMIGMYLQNAEKVIMTHANILWRKELEEAGIDFKQVNFVHDEFVTEVPSDPEIGILVGTIQAQSIKETGEKFGLRCPLGGEYKVGKNWLEVH